MARRTTTIGIGAFGNWTDPGEHLKQTYRRIRNGQMTLTEDAVFVMTLFMLQQRGKTKHIFKAVRQSKDIGGQEYFWFRPDVDLLEVRHDGTVVGYELKGIQKSKSTTRDVTFYEGLDQALSLLVNPVDSPLSDSVPPEASIFDHVYLVHPSDNPAGEVHSGAFARLVDSCTPAGLIYVGHNRWKEAVSPKPNPHVNQELKNLFLQNLDAFAQYQKFRLSLVQ